MLFSHHVFSVILQITLISVYITVVVGVKKHIRGHSTSEISDDSLALLEISTPPQTYWLPPAFGGPSGNPFQANLSMGADPARFPAAPYTSEFSIYPQAYKLPEQQLLVSSNQPTGTQFITTTPTTPTTHIVSTTPTAQILGLAPGQQQIHYVNGQPQQFVIH